MKFTENGMRLLRRRYLRKDNNGNVVETPEELLDRVSKCLSHSEIFYGGKTKRKKWYNIIKNSLNNMEIMPSTPILFNARDPEIEKPGVLYACFFVPMSDSIQGIYSCLHLCSSIFSAGGGIGTDVSCLRENGADIGNGRGVSTGPISFLKVFDASSDAILHGGVRRAAALASMDVSHPDIEHFLRVKGENLQEINRLLAIVNSSKDGILKKYIQAEISKLQQLSHFNLSVKITDKFMDAVRNNKDWELISPHTGSVVKTISAAKLFNDICRCAHNSAEPGVIFIDEINRHNPMPNIGPINGTNACSEVPLHDYNACNLISVNLNKCLANEEFSFDELKRISRIALRCGENVIDVSSYLDEKIENIVKNSRGIGVGVTGFADVLVRLGIPYDSKRARDFVRKITKVLTDSCREESKELAKERGVFNNYKGSLMEKKGFVVRNAFVSALQPTGSTAILAGASQSIEPYFSLFYTRNTHEGDVYVELNEIFIDKLKKMNIDTECVVNELKKGKQLCDIDIIPDEIKRVFVTSHLISAEGHVRMQAAAQENIDLSISKTVNLPSNATVNDVKNVYLLAEKLGCKGCTVYRDGSREGVLHSVVEKEESDGNEELRDFLYNKFVKEGLTAKEIADILDVSESQVFSKLKRFCIKKSDKNTTISAKKIKLTQSLKEIIIANLLVGNSKINTVESQSSYRQVSDHCVYTKNIRKKFLDNGINCSEIMTIVTDKIYYYFDTVFNSNIYNLPADNDVVDKLSSDEIDTLLTRTFVRHLFLVGGVRTGRGGIKFCSKHGNYNNLKKIMQLVEKELGVEFSYKQKENNNGIVYIPKRCAEDFYNFIESGEQINKINSIQSKATCPECGGMLNFCEGCKTCASCGWSACSIG